MALSDYEKQVLEQLEQQLRGEDLDLGASFDEAQQAQQIGNDADVIEMPRLVFGPRVFAAMFVSALVGLVLLFVGVTLFQTLMVAGIAVAVIGFALLVFALTLPANKKIAPKLRSKNQPNVPLSGPKKTFMQRQEEKFDRRRDKNFGV